jgi:carboxymethylenebutenolidase
MRHMVDLKDYLRDEIEEEGQLGYLSKAESVRRVGLLDAQASDAQASDGPVATTGAGTADDVFDDGVVTASWQEIAGASGTLSVYLAQPAQSAQPTHGRPVPGVVVVHENKGLVPYVQDVARRLAAAGFVALAPDLLSPAGGTRSFSDPAEATAALGKLAPADMVADLKAAVTYLIDSDAVTDAAVGVVGFCFGGGMAWRLITQDQRLRGAVPFYGPNPPLEDVDAIQTPVFAIYGALDARITGGLPDIEAAMNEHGKTFEKIVLPDAQHAFHNDTNPDRYNADAAAEAWAAALQHLNTWLKG